MVRFSPSPKLGLFFFCSPPNFPSFLSFENLLVPVFLGFFGFQLSRAFGFGSAFSSGFHFCLFAEKTWEVEGFRLSNAGFRREEELIKHSWLERNELFGQGKVEQVWDMWLGDVLFMSLFVLFAGVEQRLKQMENVELCDYWFVNKAVWWFLRKIKRGLISVFLLTAF